MVRFYFENNTYLTRQCKNVLSILAAIYSYYLHSGNVQEIDHKTAKTTSRSIMQHYVRVQDSKYVHMCKKYRITSVSSIQLRRPNFSKVKLSRFRNLTLSKVNGLSLLKGTVTLSKVNVLRF
jgi:hypothetical protein